MTLAQLQYFEGVADYGSMSKAAEHLYVSQPAISKQIKLLEKELGFELFDRHYGTVHVTPAGKILLDFIRRERVAFNAAIEKARLTVKNKAPDLLHIGLFELANVENLTNILFQFAKKNPQLSINLEEQNFADLMSGLVSHKYDLIVTLDHTLRGIPNIMSSTLVKAHHVAYISKEHPLARKPDLVFSDLSNEAFYVPSLKDQVLAQDLLYYICSEHDFIPNNVETLPNIDSVLLVIQMGSGVVVLDDQTSIRSTANLIAIPTNVYSTVKIAWIQSNQNIYMHQIVKEIEIEMGKPL